MAERGAGGMGAGQRGEVRVEWGWFSGGGDVRTSTRAGWMAVAVFAAALAGGAGRAQGGEEGFSRASAEDCGMTYRYTLRCWQVPLGRFLGELSSLRDERNAACPQDVRFCYCHFTEDGTQLAVLTGEDLKALADREDGEWPDAELAVPLSTNFERQDLLSILEVVAACSRHSLVVVSGKAYLVPREAVETFFASLGVSWPGAEGGEPCFFPDIGEGRDGEAGR